MTRVALHDAQSQAQEVLGRVTAGCDIRVAHLEVTAGAPVHRVSLDVEVSLAMSVNYAADQAIVCVSRYEVTAQPADDDDLNAASDEDGWVARIEVHGVWPLSSCEALSAQHAQAFGLAVGAMALHPYARAHLQSTVAATGYPVFTLGVLNSLMEPSEADGLVDLDHVQYLDAV